ncbi:MAG: glycosyltransferase, partial [Mariprofundales bacterium]
MIKCLHIVREYGQVGGMENYVWHLTHELALLGHHVLILCAKKADDSPLNPHIQLVELGVIRQKPRWLAHLIFSYKVSAWVTKNANKINDYIIH